MPKGYVGLFVLITNLPGLVVELIVTKGLSPLLNSNGVSVYPFRTRKASSNWKEAVEEIIKIKVRSNYIKCLMSYLYSIPLKTNFDQCSVPCLCTAACVSSISVTSHNPPYQRSASDHVCEDAADRPNRVQ